MSHCTNEQMGKSFAVPVAFPEGGLGHGAGPRAMIRANVVDSKPGALVLPKARGRGHWPHIRQKLQSPLSIWFHAEA